MSLIPISAANPGAPLLSSSSRLSLPALGIVFVAAAAASRGASHGPFKCRETVYQANELIRKRKLQQRREAREGNHQKFPNGIVSHCRELLTFYGASLGVQRRAVRGYRL